MYYSISDQINAGFQVDAFSAIEGETLFGHSHYLKKGKEKLQKKHLHKSYMATSILFL